MRAPVAVVGAVRTPIGRYLGAWAEVGAIELAAAAIRQALAQSGVSAAEIDEVILGQARQAGCGPNPARQAAIRAGIRQETPAYTVNQACASGLKAVFLGADAVRNGARFAVVGGMENMSQVPFILPGMRLGYGQGSADCVDAMYRDGFHCPLADQLMGRTAETLAEKYGISREEQDAFALLSQQRAGLAEASGLFADERRAVEAGGQKLLTDEHARPKTTLESLAKLPPVFKKGGGVHAGNSSGITDGAAALVLAAPETARAAGLEVLALFEDGLLTGVDPKIMGIGPVPAVKALLGRLGRKLDDYGRVELNEAFAAQVLACQRELEIEPSRLNARGGSIALGHPIGCSGARIAVTLIHTLKQESVPMGLATACVSGGMGIAASFARP